jgi:mono/diheme cytochrome c family protein
MQSNTIMKNLIMLLAGGVALAACTASGDNPGLEYAPNMYHSVAYEPLTQITDETSGAWVSSIEDGKGEYYNSNPNNPHGMTMREPAPHTVRRSSKGYLPYRIHKDSFALAERVLKSPLEVNEAVLAEGKVLYTRFCAQCHGADGQEPGKVGEVYGGVANYKSSAVVDKKEGHIYHVITHGKGRMGAHASQISEEDRWKIVSYVQLLQKQ